jgi:hypothetical protein
MYKNRKIRGSKITEVDGIRFRSKIESCCYQKLKESGFNFSYEKDKLIILNKFKPNISVFLPHKKISDHVVETNCMIREISYLTDFTVYINGDTIVYLEIKGYPNDVYPIKRKLIINYLNSLRDKTYIFAEVHNLKQLDSLISKLKEKYHV